MKQGGTFPASSLRGGSPGSCQIRIAGAARSCKAWPGITHTGSAVLARTSCGRGPGRGTPRDLPVLPQEIRAMDRRRYVPSPEGLEVRTMLSTTSSGIFGGSTTTTQTLPITFQQKELRIQKMPHQPPGTRAEPLSAAGDDQPDPARAQPDHVGHDRTSAPGAHQLQPVDAEDRLQLVGQRQQRPAARSCLHRRAQVGPRSRARPDHPDDGGEPACQPGRHGQRRSDEPGDQRQRLPPSARDRDRPEDARARAPTIAKSTGTRSILASPSRR